MHFKFKNGNRRCSIEGQEFSADAEGVISIPPALDARARLDWGDDIVSAEAPKPKPKQQVVSNAPSDR